MTEDPVPLPQTSILVHPSGYQPQNTQEGWSQRILATNIDELLLLECQNIELSPAP